MRGFALCVLVLAACGDSLRSAPIDAAIDAPPDARVLPAGSACVSSADCASDPARPACCLVVHAGGLAEPTACVATTPSPPLNCGEVACDPASREPCMTIQGKPGTCQYAAFGPGSPSHYWVCRAS